MLFNSLVFFSFLSIVLSLYWAIDRQEYRQTLLLVSSLIFYAAWFPPHLILLLSLVTICWFAALSAIRFKRASVILAAIVLLGALGYWKYSAFFLKILRDIGFDAGWMAYFPASLALPLGISFIVFQGLGYVIDVAKGEKEPEPRWGIVILFKAYFPQLIAGPICRAQELMPQLKQKMVFDHGTFASGLAILVVGLFLKVVFADNVSPVVDRYFLNAAGLSTSQAWFASLGFSIQILADFWGYSTMAYGMSLMFGIVLPVNFRLPYLATNIRDFWRRWHITLSQWLRDYLYKALGGSHKGYLRTFVALMATMLIGGLWHGANYTFIVWGALHGTALAIEHGALSLKRSFNNYIPAANVIGIAGKGVSWVYTMTVVLIGWVIFRATDLQSAGYVLKAMVKGLPSFSEIPIGFAILVVVFFLIHIPVEKLLERLRDKEVSTHWCYLISGWLLAVSIIMSAEDAAPFIYFQF